MAKFKFFNGPYVDQILQGDIIKDAQHGWALQLKSGEVVPLEFSVRMGRHWRDVHVVSTSDAEIVFRPVFRFGFRGKKFARPTEDFT